MIERRLGLRSFEHTDHGAVFATACKVAISIDRFEAVVAGMVERLRGTSAMLPRPAVIERSALVTLAWKRGGRLSPGSAATFDWSRWSSSRRWGLRQLALTAVMAKPQRFCLDMSSCRQLVKSHAGACDPSPCSQKRCSAGFADNAIHSQKTLPMGVSPRGCATWTI